MASTRPMRKSSRMSSPLDVSVKKGITTPIEQAKVDRETWLGTWIEPPLRNPAPSFEDYKGLERHGVLEHMAPLGSLPTQKVKLRVKAEPPKRVLQVKNGHSTAAKEKTPETIPTVIAQPPQSRKAEDKPPKPLPPREIEDDEDYTPQGLTKAATPTRPVSAKGTQAPTSLHGTPNSRTAAGRARLETVVNSAVARSYEIGNPVLGLAVKKLFDESLGNRTLADLLDAVLSQNPTPRQASDFQAYIKVARKQIKAQNAGRDSTTTRRSSEVGINVSSNSASKSPSKSIRLGGAAGENRISKEATPSHPQKPNSNSDSVSKNKIPNSKIQEIVGMETRGAKRSRSSSDTSSLSSLSSIDQTFAPSMETDHANTAETHATPQPMTASKVQPSLGPKLHTFSTTKVTNNNTSLKRTSTAAGLGDKDGEESLATKRAKLQKTFEDYTVHESSIRVGPAVKEPTPALAASKPSPSSSVHTHQTRLRNGAGKRPRDENDDLESLSSSAHGDLLVPPPPGAQTRSRSGTPRDHLGRPSKIRKTARVKMS